jgi:hypothetical protein
MSIGFDSDEVILEKLRERLRRMRSLHEGMVNQAITKTGPEVGLSCPRPILPPRPSHDCC